MTELDIVIVNWNSGELLRKCIASLGAAGEPDAFFAVTVVDNASSDGSADALQAGQVPLTVVRNVANSGFAAACNQGARLGRAPYLLLLNPDTVVRRQGLRHAIDFMESVEATSLRVGICGLQLRDAAGEVSRSCARFPSAVRQIAFAGGLERLFPRLFAPHFMTEWDHQSSRVVDEVIGAFFLVRRALYEALGGLDERFFVYFEEVDFCRRALDRGWRTYFLGGEYATHIGGGTTDRIRATRLFYSWRSRVLYAHKHFSIAGARGVEATVLVLEPVVRALRALVHLDWKGAGEVARAATLLWRHLADIHSTARGMRTHVGDASGSP